MSGIKIPTGLKELAVTFGDPSGFVENQPTWMARTLASRVLTREIPYAYAKGVKIQKLTAHRLLVDQFVGCVEKCLDSGVAAGRLTYGGIYCWRAMRSGTKFSTHTWGIAIDIDPGNNPQGKSWKDDGKMLHPKIIETFLEAGFIWGNGFSNPDPMHFQYVKRY